MQYKYRWLYAFAAICFIIFCAYSGDFQLLLNQQAKLNKQEKRLINRLQSFKPILSKPALYFNKTFSDRELLDQLITLAHLNNIILIKYIQMKTVQVVARGSFIQLAFFVEEINQSDKIMLLDFSCYKLPDHKIEMTMQVAALPYLVSKFSRQKNNIIVSINEEMSSLVQMKMTGRLRQGRRQMAIIALPTGRVLAVNVGSKIGKEQGVVRAIYHDRIVVEHNKKRVVIMKM